MPRVPEVLEKVVVRDSPIHGQGVFATRRIEPGEIVIDGCRDVLSDEEVKTLPAEEREFLSMMNGRHVLMRPPSRFVNHSCSPNARGTDRGDIAVAAIDVGDEVTVDYAAEQVTGLRLVCNCGAPNCRGLIERP